MSQRAMVRRTAAGLALAVTLSVGVSSFIPPAFGCDGTNAGAGNCKQAYVPPRLDTWAVARDVVGEIVGVLLP